MPPRDLRMWLTDVRDACAVIARCADGQTAETFASDVILRSAVERQFEIIGEAMKRIIAAEPSLSLRLPESREVIAFRNFLAHGYHLIDHREVWRIMQSDVPTLLARVEQILSER